MDTIIKSLKNIAFCNKGNDLLALEILNYINAKDKYCFFMINDFKHLGTYRQVRSALEYLVKIKYLKKIKAYPVFYEKI